MRAMSIIYMVTESLPMVAILTPLADVVCVGFKTSLPLRNITPLSIGDTIVTMRIKERGKCGSGWSIVLGAM